MYEWMLQSPIGPLTLFSGGEAVMELRFGDLRLGGPGCALLERAAEELGEYFAGARRVFTVPLAPAGTPFQRLVWDALREIPYGTTATYGEIAARIGRPGAARAVGSANHHNPLSIFVPCHRVLGANGALTGYAGGLEAKRKLLAIEGVRLSL